MKIFLDTSSLFKLYHKEIDTEIMEDIFSKNNVTTIYLSEITKLEFVSTIWKKFRTKEISLLDAENTLALFELDSDKYDFIKTDTLVIERSNRLLKKYGVSGLRTLDSIQLSSALTIKNNADLFISADKLLVELLKEEGLKTTF
jgi:uncharacterized protein